MTSGTSRAHHKRLHHLDRGFVSPRWFRVGRILQDMMRWDQGVAA